MFSHLPLDDLKITDLDYLLNKGRLDEATTVLTGEAYSQEQQSMQQSIQQSTQQSIQYSNLTQSI